MKLSNQYLRNACNPREYSLTGASRMLVYKVTRWQLICLSADQ